MGVRILRRAVWRGKISLVGNLRFGANVRFEPTLSIFCDAANGGFSKKKTSIKIKYTKFRKYPENWRALRLFID